MSQSARRRCTDEWKKAQSESKRTKIDPESVFIELHNEGYTQMQLANEFNVGRKVVSNAIKRLGLKSHKATKRNQWGSKNDNWRGKEATLVNKHRRLYRAFGQPSKCEVCGTEDKSKTYDWANLTGNYDDPKDFKRMCRSCHRKYDNQRRRCGM
jgi:hypothetical protein